jgi:ribosomal protein S18 acetylase RimI-like enzyme
MSQLNIRPCTEADKPALRELFLRVRQHTFLWVDPASLRLEDFDKATEGETILVAEVEGTIAGFVSWWPPENFLHNLFIDTSRQRAGAGAALLAACLEQTGRPVRLKTSIQNASAIAFYRKHGFKVTSNGFADEGEYHLMEYP